MERIKSLERYPKVVLLLMAAMILVFTVAYPMTISRKGFAYADVILVPSQENGNTVYSGKIHGEPSCFTVFADKTVTFQYGDKTYGPYTAKVDPTAVPKDEDMGTSMTGVELFQGEKLIFRGGVLNTESGLWLYNQDGTVENSNVSITVGATNGVQMDADGNIIDWMEPSAANILSLMAGPQLTHKGEWTAWLCGVFVCVVAAISILFADELFQWNLAFRIRNVYDAEPSDWEITSRYITWTAVLIMAMILFITGLQ